MIVLATRACKLHVVIHGFGDECVEVAPYGSTCDCLMKDFDGEYPRVVYKGSFPPRVLTHARLDAMSLGFMRRSSTLAIHSFKEGPSGG